MEIRLPIIRNKIILALGAESAGNFSVYSNNRLFFSDDFGDLLEEDAWRDFKSAVLEYLKKKKIRPDVIISDLHPSFNTTLWGKELAKKYEAEFFQIQHHHAHIFSAIGDKMIRDTRYEIRDTTYGIAMDGTGYAKDEVIWGGEVFVISNSQFPILNKNLKAAKKTSELTIKRIGHLENQVLIGGELAIHEPARVLIGILNRFLDKKEVYRFVKKYYTKNEFEVLYNQLRQNFNCFKTSSAGRVLDAISLLLGFCKNERKYKHEPISLLETSSTKPYLGIKPKMEYKESAQISKKYYELNTTFLFEYLINNFNKDKNRLAATAQLYLAQGFQEIIEKDIQNTKYTIRDTFIAGGISNNKIISEYLISQSAYAAKTIPRGDAGISFGQLIYFFLMT